MVTKTCCNASKLVYKAYHDYYSRLISYGYFSLASVVVWAILVNYFLVSNPKFKHIYPESTLTMKKFAIVKKKETCVYKKKKS